MKMRAPRQPKPKKLGGKMAFGGGGGARAFRDPTSMLAPDQAFTAAMARGGPGASPAMPSVGAAPAPGGMPSTSTG